MSCFERGGLAAVEEDNRFIAAMRDDLEHGVWYFGLKGAACDDEALYHALEESAHYWNQAHEFMNDVRLAFDEGNEFEGLQKLSGHQNWWRFKGYDIRKGGDWRCGGQDEYSVMIAGETVEEAMSRTPTLIPWLVPEIEKEGPKSDADFGFLTSWPREKEREALLRWAADNPELPPLTGPTRRAT